MKEIRDSVKQIAEIAASVPESLQSLCFELLLRHYLESLSTSSDPGNTQSRKTPPPAAEVVVPVVPASIEEKAKVQTDLSTGDLHVKTRRFMEKYGVTLDELNNLFFKEDETIQPLYEDVKTTRLAEAQIRIALLLALRNALLTGEFAAPVEAVRAECRDRKSYDQANFAANLKNNQSLFDEKYGKDTTTLRLSEDGRKELSQLIKELQ
jgi:hypothetical protein